MTTNLERFYERLADAIMELSDEELLQGARDAGVDIEAEVAAVKAVIERAIEDYRSKERRAEADKQRRGLEVLKEKSEQHGASVCTTDGRPPDPDFAGTGSAPQPAGAGGQHGAYYVLCEEERRKGFVRPVRNAYRHVGSPGPAGKGCGAVTTMGRALAETYARDPHFYGSTFCVGCGAHFPVGERSEFVWVDGGERVGT